MRSRDELRSRLSEDGVIFGAGDYLLHCQRLESNGDGPHDTGALPGLPHKIVQLDPDRPSTRWEPHPPRPWMLKRLRLY
jgi:hypothetical protein